MGLDNLIVTLGEGEFFCVFYTQILSAPPVGF